MIAQKSTANKHWGMGGRRTKDRKIAPILSTLPIF